MSRSLLSPAAAGVAWALAAFSGDAAAMCIPMPCRDCDLVSRGQLNFVVMDRQAGRVQLIPNIRLVGDAEDFALVVPTPALPEITAAPVEIWDQLSGLTAPLWTTRWNSDRFSCGAASELPLSPPDTEGDGVTVHGRETVGAFIATILSSDDPGALVRYLRERNFPVARRSRWRWFR
jgi:hypothetical protein